MEVDFMTHSIFHPAIRIYIILELFSIKLGIYFYSNLHLAVKRRVIHTYNINLSSLILISLRNDLNLNTFKDKKFISYFISYTYKVV